QQKNLFYFLDKAQKSQLNKLKDEYQIKYGKDLNEYKDNVVHGLMMEQIDFLYFTEWLSHIDLEGNNTLFVYEPEETETFQKNNIENIYKDAEKIVDNIYEINPNNLMDIKLINVSLINEKQQIIFTYVAPSYIQKKSDDGITPNMEKNVYMAYIIMDFKAEHFVLSLHPTNNLHSIGGIVKRKDWDNLAPQFINVFRKHILKFNFKDPEWILDVLCDITDEYFDHNNPIIYKKMVDFETELLNDLLDKLSSLEPSFEKSPFKLRTAKVLRNLYENELILNYKVIPKKTPFTIFQHSSDKGITSFRANAKGRPLSFSDSREVVKMMIDNADVSTLGIIYTGSNTKNYAYKISKTANYFCLKRITTAVTEKEIVDDVLYKLKEYKSRKKDEYSTISAGEVK
ncbi:hypothetical protein CCZ20_28125, partial [Priestia aryabhattai]|uniref:hypothetical protein n=1 Tax=Priestia aryabhattai TaxID=412384 RepID=UPI000B6651D7